MTPTEPSVPDRLTRPETAVAEAIHVAVMLLSLGFVERARELLEDLVRLPPAGQNALIELCHRIATGERLKNPTGATDDRDKKSEILIVPKPRARRVIMVFGWGPGRYQEIDNPVLLRRSDFSVIYLRNNSNGHYLAGIEGVGTTYDECLVGFRKIFAGLQAGEEAGGEIYCIGHSVSGYAALRFGLDLGARGVLCTSPYTTLNVDDMPAGAVVKLLEGVDVPAGLTRNVAPLYRAAPRRPLVTLCYGADNKQDHWMAETMRDLPDVTLLPLAGVAEHNSLIELSRQNRFNQLIEAMLAE